MDKEELLKLVEKGESQNIEYVGTCFFLAHLNLLIKIWLDLKLGSSQHLTIEIYQADSCGGGKCSSSTSAPYTACASSPAANVSLLR